jgi:hypothetical protein
MEIEMRAIKEATTETLKESAKIAMNDFRDGVDLALEKILDELESRMPEKEFISFTETL